MLVKEGEREDAERQVNLLVGWLIDCSLSVSLFLSKCSRKHSLGQV